MQQLNGWAGEPPESLENTAAEAVAAADQPAASGGPTRVVRACVASLSDRHAFGPMMAAEAQERGFYQATQKAVVRDGAAHDGSIWRGYFSDVEPGVDFLHAVCDVYGAARGVGATEGGRWPLDRGWMRARWPGRVGEVLADRKECSVRAGVVPEGEALAARDPRRLVAEALSYPGNNQSRMDYPRYRRAGLPRTSRRVESPVGEFNARLKSAQKYWNRPAGPEPILQLRAAVLRGDDRLGRFFAQRPGSPIAHAERLDYLAVRTNGSTNKL